MYRRLAVGVCALTLAAMAVAFPSRITPTVDAASACTDWSSTLTPPPTIRVLRTYGSAAGKVQTVALRAYVENVMSWEWPEAYPFQALRAGAVAVKQYAWYYAIHWRGGRTASGACYDVKDTSIDQIYRPETRSAGTKQLRAVASTWNLSVRRQRDGKPGRFILTGYLPGSISTCGAERNGFRLYQKGVKACAKAGKSYEQIARIYYGATLQLTETGRHNTVGGAYGLGDLGAAVPNGQAVDVSVHRSVGDAFQPGGEPDVIEASDDTTLSRVSADVDGDGFEELVILLSDGETAQRIEVRHPSGYGFGDPVPGLAWDSGAAGASFTSWRDGRPGVRLVAADIDSDGDDDLVLIVTGDDPSSGSVQVLESTKTSLRPISQAFAGAFDPGTSSVFAGDASGDGRADIVLQTETGSGLTFRVMRTLAKPPSEPIVIGAPAMWYTAEGLTTADSRTVVTDYDRDSRDDIVLAVGDGSGLTFRGLHSKGGVFTPFDLRSSSIAIDRVKLVTSDVTHDGRGDLVVYTRLADGSFGTRLYVFRATASGLATGELWDEDLGLDWQNVEPH